MMKWYRSLLLNSVVQKHHYRFMRSRLMVILGAVFLDSQCGGFRGKGATLASLGVCGFLAATCACLVSSMALFVGLKSGCYTVAKELCGFSHPVRTMSVSFSLSVLLRSWSLPCSG